MANPETGAAKRRLTTLEKAAKAVASSALPDELTAEAAGRVRAVERNLAGFRQSILAEASGPSPDLTGGGFKLVEKRTCKRSYSLAPIVADVSAATGKTSFEVIMDMIAGGALSLTVGWQNLERYFVQHDITLRKAGHEITNDGDVDGPHVGEVWTSKVEQVAVTS